MGIIVVHSKVFIGTLLFHIFVVLLDLVLVLKAFRFHWIFDSAFSLITVAVPLRNGLSTYCGSVAFSISRSDRLLTLFPAVPLQN